MGCDIHPICQFKVFSDDNFWENCGIPDRTRNYQFFSHLAGVRGDCDSPLAARRGLPDGFMRYQESCLSGEHSASWCTLAEMKAYDTSGMDEDYGLPAWKRWIEYGEFMAKHFGKSDEEIRFVFDFDS